MEYIMRIAITIFIYMLIPFIISLTKIKMKKWAIITIVVINGIVCFILFRFIQLATGVTPSSNASPAIIWSWVNYWLLKKKCLARINIYNNTDFEFGKTAAWEPIKDEPIEEVPDITINEEECIPQKQKSIKLRYCKYCGGLIDKDSKKCTECGKQYFKINKKILFISSICIITIILVGVIIFQYSEIDYLQSKTQRMQTRIDELEEDNASLWLDLYNSQVQNDFYEEHVVFVSDGNYYHKYDCNYFDSSSFNAYNVELALYLEYQPCKHCCR